MQLKVDISQDKALLWLMAIACGLCAGANYYSQPLIHSIHLYFQVPEDQVALTVTFAQISYALGLLFIVPIGDIVNKTKLIPLLMFLASLSLFLCAFSTSLPMLWIGTVLTGLFSVAAQVLIPFATMAVSQKKIGEVIGLLMSGLLVGILLSTSLAGLLSNLYNWKVIYFVSAIFMLFLAIFLKKKLPILPISKLHYGEILLSMGQLLKYEKRLVFRSFTGAFAFASMSVLFSTIALLLKSKFYLSDMLVGVVTLVGVFGALSTKKIGQFADRGFTQKITLLGLLTLAISWIFLYFGKYSLMSYILGFGVINLGLALIHTSNQNIVFRLKEDAKSRINSIYMTMYFLGGATGSALGVYAWQHGGWDTSCIVGFSLVLLSACFAFLDKYWLFKTNQP